MQLFRKSFNLLCKSFLILKRRTQDEVYRGKAARRQRGEKMKYRKEYIALCRAHNPAGLSQNQEYLCARFWNVAIETVEKRLKAIGERESKRSAKYGFSSMTAEIIDRFLTEEKTK
jgi:hypothetical protein